MSKIGWLCGIWVFLTFHGFCLGQNSFVFKIDGEYIKYDAPLGYCAIQETTLDRIWPKETCYIGIAVFCPCKQRKNVDKEALEFFSRIHITTPRDPKLRHYNMSREQFLKESQTLLRTVTFGEERTTYYGDRQVPEDFKRPTPLLLSCHSSDKYAVYQLGPYFIVKDGNTIKSAQEQVVATTLIKGKVVEIIYEETDFARTKTEMMVKRLKEYTKAFVEGNYVQLHGRP
jgi:hypothetical protein